MAIADVIARGELFDLMALLIAGGNEAARLPSAIDTLAVDAAISAALDARQVPLITEVREADVSWARIAAALGLGRTTAFRRYDRIIKKRKQNT